MKSLIFNMQKTQAFIGKDELIKIITFNCGGSNQGNTSRCYNYFIVIREKATSFLMNTIEEGNSNRTSVITPVKKVLKSDLSMSALWLVFGSVIV